MELASFNLSDKSPANRWIKIGDRAPKNDEMYQQRPKKKKWRTRMFGGIWNDVIFEIRLTS